MPSSAAVCSVHPVLARRVLDGAGQQRLLSIRASQRSAKRSGQCRFCVVCLGALPCESSCSADAAGFAAAMTNRPRHPWRMCGCRLGLQQGGAGVGPKEKTRKIVGLFFGAMSAWGASPSGVCVHGRVQKGLGLRCLFSSPASSFTRPPQQILGPGSPEPFPRVFWFWKASCEDRGAFRDDCVASIPPSCPQMRGVSYKQVRRCAQPLSNLRLRRSGTPFVCTLRAIQRFDTPGAMASVLMRLLVLSVLTSLAAPAAAEEPLVGAGGESSRAPEEKDAKSKGAEPSVGCGIWESCYKRRCCGSGSCSRANATHPALGCGVWESCYQGRCCGSGSC